MHREVWEGGQAQELDEGDHEGKAHGRLLRETEQARNTERVGGNIKHDCQGRSG